MLKTVDRYGDILSKGAVLRHAEDRVFVRLYFRVGTPVDVRVYHDLLSYPWLMNFIVNLLDHAAAIRTENGTEPDVRIFPIDDPLVAPIQGDGLPFHQCLSVRQLRLRYVHKFDFTGRGEFVGFHRAKRGGL